MRSSAIENQTPMDFWQRANSYTCPRGKDPGTAFVLIHRLDFDFGGTVGEHTLKITDDVGSGKTIEIKRLTTVKSLSMVRELPFKASGVPALVELQDVRARLAMSDINRQFNVRIPSPSGIAGSDLYYPESLNGGSLWTWQTALDAIWQLLPLIAGPAPELPLGITGEPEGFRFIGVSAWDALHVVLEKLQVTTAYNPVDDTFAYVPMGGSQDVDFALKDFSERLMYDYSPGKNHVLGRVPQTFVFYFQRREQFHGIELDTVGTGNWEMTPAVPVSFPTGIAGVEPGSVVPIWDDLPALIDGSGTITNIAALNARAAALGQRLTERVDFGDEKKRRIYSGVLTAILPGTEITSVAWRDYGDSTGLVTDIVQSHKKDPPPAPNNSLGMNVGIGSGFLGEHLATPDFSRNQYPTWPRLPQPVIVDDGTTDTGEDVAANGDGLIPGFVRRYVTGWSTLDACWIRPIDLEGGSGPSEANVVPLRQRDTVMGRLSGSITSGGSTLPLYLVRKGVEAAGTSPPNILWGKCTTNWKKNRPTECDFVVINPVDNCLGDNPTGAEFTIRLPREAERDPNLIEDDVIAYRTTFSGELVCLSAYSSLKIGMVTMWALALGGIPPGWAAMDGAANSSGSGINMNSGASDGGGRFVRGSDTAGKVGGTSEHTHNIVILVDAVSFTEAISVGLRIDDHTIAELSHQHAIIEDTPSFGFEAGVGSPDTNIHLDCTTGPVDYDDLDQQACASQPNWGPLVHRFSVSGAGGDVYTEAFGDSFIDSSPHIPENTTLIFIERIDNSA